MSEIIKNRIDFVYIFDVQDGNPNGDPEAGNLPRVDAESRKGLVTDVCLKRKVRNYVQIAKEGDPNYDIYVKEKAVLGRSHKEAFKSLGITLGEESKIRLSENAYSKELEENLCEGLTLEEDEEGELLVLAADAEKDEIKKWIRTANLPKDIQKSINEALKKTRKQTSEDTNMGNRWMCNHFYDIRTFGAVMSLKSAPNCGQVRGPVQLTFARSVDPITPAEHSITRMAVATEKEAEKQSGDNRTMGRKATVPYGLYLCHGFISANLAKQTGFSEEDLELFFEALKNMFDVDRSAARGLMSAQKLIVFRHESALGNAPANKLFDLVKVEKCTQSAPRSFADYKVTPVEEIREGLKSISTKIEVEELI